MLSLKKDRACAVHFAGLHSIPDRLTLVAQFEASFADMHLKKGGL